MVPRKKYIKVPIVTTKEDRYYSISEEAYDPENNKYPIQFNLDEMRDKLLSTADSLEEFGIEKNKSIQFAYDEIQSCLWDIIDIKATTELIKELCLSTKELKRELKKRKKEYSSNGEE